MSFDLGLDGKRALVTGGTKGVGAAVVQGLVAAGVRVATTARTVPEKGSEKVHYVAADLMTGQGCAKVAEAVVASSAASTSSSMWLEDRARQQARRIIELATAARELHILDVAEAALEWVEVELEASRALAAVGQSSPTEAAIRQRKQAWVIQKAINN